MKARVRPKDHPWKGWKIIGRRRLQNLRSKKHYRDNREEILARQKESRRTKCQFST